MEHPAGKSRSKIQRLPSALINQIAAGEVVERPASLIKELVENSLDAGATRIEVLLEAGGLESLTVTDNGGGMDSDDLTLCIERHATSKLRRPEDLEAIGSFGFRGEALASIAEVSHLDIRTRPARRPSGQQLQVMFGKAEPLRPIGMPAGTQVRVKSLFERLPARRKFLRSSTTEFSHCARWLREIALGNPGVAFALTHQNRRIFSCVAQSQTDRVREGLRPKWNPLRISQSQEDISLEAYLAPPLAASKTELYLFINGRCVRHRTLFAAIRSCYADLGGPQAQAAGVLYLELPLDQVDVNVHPQKTEVRLWRQERLIPWIRSLVHKAVARAASETDGAHPNMAYPSGGAPRDLGPWELRDSGAGASPYRLWESGDDLWLVHVGRLARQQQLRALLNNDATQRLDPPIVFSLAVSERDALEASALREMGFAWEDFGNGDIAVHHAPAALRAETLSTRLKQVLHWLGTNPAAPNAAALAEQLIGEVTSEIDLASAFAEGNPPPSVAYPIPSGTLSAHFERNPLL